MTNLIFKEVELVTTLKNQEVDQYDIVEKNDDDDQNRVIKDRKRIKNVDLNFVIIATLKRWKPFSDGATNLNIMLMRWK